MNNYPDIPGPDVSADPALGQLLEQLRSSHNNAICGTLLYGSCLRSGDIYDGLIDLYLICDNYRAAYGRPFIAAANWLLPPNVFYAELKLEDKTLRSKVTMISLRDFRRGCTGAWFESYIWGRFAQPTRILYSRDAQTRAALQHSLLQAGRTLLHNSLPALPEQGSVTSLWERALALSYSTELRSERPGRSMELAESARAFYAAVTRHHAPSLGFGFTVYDSGGELHYRSEIAETQRRSTRMAWSLRRGQGKVLSVLRVVKALFTFEGGLDYIAWKLERHSGETIVIPDKVRRAPLLHLWGFFWGLYRRGIFK
ncbi:MAG: hypothetical protein H6985_00375 [Pseudomonadales bacterium]|nr:hypothetical protein [Halioglobus sp.]MCP5128015.1 hypothetical protein [Pseudomonadales bacterium]